MCIGKYGEDSSEDFSCLIETRAAAAALAGVPPERCHTHIVCIKSAPPPPTVCFPVPSRSGLPPRNQLRQRCSPRRRSLGLSMGMSHDFVQGEWAPSSLCVLPPLVVVAPELTGFHSPKEPLRLGRRRALCSILCTAVLTACAEPPGIRSDRVRRKLHPAGFHNLRRTDIRRQAHLRACRRLEP